MLRKFLCQGHTDDHRSKTFFSRSPFCSSSLDRSCAMLCLKHLVNIAQKKHLSPKLSTSIKRLAGGFTLTHLNEVNQDQDPKWGWLKQQVVDIANRLAACKDKYSWSSYIHISSKRFKYSAYPLGLSRAHTIDSTKRLREKWKKQHWNQTIHVYPCKLGNSIPSSKKLAPHWNPGVSKAPAGRAPI